MNKDVLLQPSNLTPVERREKGKVLLRDTAALCVLAGLAVVLSFVTYALFHSFAAHQRMLEARWRARGESALATGQPAVALDDLHSALAYAPDDRGIEVELATALAATGRLQEAQVYFTTLLESEPGNGMINLQMARLAIRQGNTQAAVDHYQAAIDGTWNGDAFARRREIRLELARFLIAQKRFPEARNLLLITSGNGPDNFALQLELGALLEQANDAPDAIDVYRKASQHRPTRLEALEGEAHAAASEGRYAQAKTLLSEAIVEPAFARQPDEVRNATHAELETAEGVLALYPALTMPAAERGRRIAQDAELAQARLLGCPAVKAAEAAPDAASGAGAAPGAANAADPAGTQPTVAQQRTLLLGALAGKLQHLNPLAKDSAAAQAPAATPPGTATDTLSALAARWTPLPTGAALARQLVTDPAFAQNTVQLIYETERATAGACGAPTGQDALLLRIAQTPDQIEAEP